MVRVRFNDKQSRFIVTCDTGDTAKLKKIKPNSYRKKHRHWEFIVSIRIFFKFMDAFTPGLQISVEVSEWYKQEIVEYNKLQNLHHTKDAYLTSDISKKLYPHQRVGVKFLLLSKRCILGDDMGLGKTVQALVTCEELKLSNILIICPNHLMRTVWEDEINQWLLGYNVTVLRGSKDEKLKLLKEFDGGFLITNYESTRTLDGEGTQYTSLIKRIKWGAVIVDEAHNLKNRKSKQHKGVISIVKKVEYLFLLTGTPLMNRVDELWASLHAVNPQEYSSYWNFVIEHADAHPGEYGWEINPAPINPQALKLEVLSLFLRREKSQVYKDMPKLTTKDLWVDLESEQRRIYDQLEQEFWAEVTEETVLIAPVILSRIVRCRQLAFSPELVGGINQSPKTSVVIDIVTGTSEKVVIFSQFAEVIKILDRELTKIGVSCVRYIGEMDSKSKEESIDTFKNDESVQVFLSTIQAGSEGISLVVASIVIMVDKHWTPATNDQAISRVHRHGQTKPVTVYNILARDTLEEWIEELLINKQSIVDAVITRTKPNPDND